ncbi:MAG: PilZ domain-containing protein [Deltaproteobacteria bacterium]|nr:MAG: PilZ domain-containing protein [Deltaproteobacteria bacterium]
MGIERRQFPRVEVSWPVTMLTAKGPIQGEVTNISLGGAFVHCLEEPDSNETFRMIITLPDSRQFLRATARVARSRIYNPDDADELSGIGVRFVDISDDDRQYIRELVAKAQ